MASAWVFTTYHPRWSFPVHRIRPQPANRALTSRGTCWSRIEAYTFHFWFRIGFLLFIYICGSPGGVLLTGGVRWWQSELVSRQWNETCPGPDHRNIILTMRDLSKIGRDNLTYLLLYYITTSTCATVSSHILSYAAIYGYTALQQLLSPPLHLTWWFCLIDIALPVVLEDWNRYP
jgi:hypothetical protein